MSNKTKKKTLQWTKEVYFAQGWTYLEVVEDCILITNENRYERIKEVMICVSLLRETRSL